MRVYRNPALGFTIGGGANSGSQVEVNFSHVIVSSTISSIRFSFPDCFAVVAIWMKFPD